MLVEKLPPPTSGQLWYMATPYSHKSKLVRYGRYRLACQGNAALLTAGYHVYSPIAHTHQVLSYMDPKKFEFTFWQDFDKLVIDKCVGIIVLKLPGWYASVGVQAEIEYAHKTHKMVIYLAPESLGIHVHNVE